MLFRDLRLKLAEFLNARSRRLRTHLVLFGLICFLPGILAASFFAYDLGRREQRRVEQQAAVLARSFTEGVDAELRSAVAVLDALAQTLSLRNGRLEDFQQAADAVARHSDVAITVCRPDGQHLINTLIPYGSAPLPKTVDPVLIAADAEALGAKIPVVSNVYIGATSRAPYVAVIYPVSYDGKLTYLLTMAFSSERVQSKLQLGSLADSGWSATIAGRDHVVLARTRQPEIYVGKPITASLKAAVQQRGSGTLISRTLDGVDVFSTYRTSDFGWSITVSAPLSVISGPARRLAMLAGLTTLAAVATTFLAAFMYGRRLGGELQDLRANAIAVGEDRPMRSYSQHISEVAEAQRALFEAKEKIVDLLRELNHRVGNTLTIIKVIASRTLRDQHAREAISDRVSALAKAHELLSASHWRGGELGRLVELTGKGSDIQLASSGPKVVLSPKATVALAQVLQELLSNAKDHGSLVARAGRVDLSWDIRGTELIMVWREKRLVSDVGPTDYVPGFGMQIIDLCIKRQLAGVAAFDPRPEGWIINLTIPLRSELGLAVIEGMHS